VKVSASRGKREEIEDVGFKFRYETLLSYRLHLKEMAEIAFSREQQQLNRAKDALSNSREGLTQVKQALESRLKARMSSQELQIYQDYMRSLEGKIGLQETAVLDRERIVRDKRIDLLQKAKQYKAIQKLKERDFQEWQYQQNIMEQKIMNETAVTRHGREFL